MAEYIDRDAVLDLFGEVPAYTGYETYSVVVHTLISEIAPLIKDEIRKIPSEDVAKVRHGRWVQVIVHVEVDDGFVDRVKECCSVCHEPNGRRCTYFCPNCGAKMDGAD